MSVAEREEEDQEGEGEESADSVSTSDGMYNDEVGFPALALLSLDVYMSESTEPTVVYREALSIIALSRIVPE